MSTYNCPGTGHAPEAGTGYPHWMARTVKNYKVHGHDPTPILDYSARYVTCAECGKDVMARSDGTVRAHPPSRIGKEKEAARRARTAAKIATELADVRTAHERLRDEVIQLRKALA